MWLLINNIPEKIRDGLAEETHVYHAIREKFCHKLRDPGHALDWKEKIWLVLTKPYCLLANHNQKFWCVICTAIKLFALLHLNWNAHVYHYFSFEIVFRYPNFMKVLNKIVMFLWPQFFEATIDNKISWGLETKINITKRLLAPQQQKYMCHYSYICRSLLVLWWLFHTDLVQGKYLQQSSMPAIIIIIIIIIIITNMMMMIMKIIIISDTKRFT